MIQHMPMGDFFEVQCKFADVFNPLKLTDGEVGLLTGVMIMNAGENVLLLLLVGCLQVDLLISVTYTLRPGKMPLSFSHDFAKYWSFFKFLSPSSQEIGSEEGLQNDVFCIGGT